MSPTARRPTTAGKQPHPQAHDPLAGILADASALERDGVSPLDRRRTIAAMRQALRDQDESGRRRLCEAVKNLAELPQDIVLALANDQPSVSLPFIAATPLLSDDDLVKLVWSGDPVKQVTIAARPGLAAAVASALAEVAGPRVLLTLLANKSAEIPAPALQTCLARFPEDIGIHRNLIGRDRLPMAVSEALLKCATQSLQEILLSRHAVSPTATQEIQRRRGSMAPWWRSQIFSG